MYLQQVTDNGTGNVVAETAVLLELGWWTLDKDPLIRHPWAPPVCSALQQQQQQSPECA